MRLIEIHRLMDDIAETVKSVPSDYSYPSIALSEARGFIHKDLSKCLKLVSIASKQYSREAALATRYNRVKDAVEASGDAQAEKLRKNYLSGIRQGEYRAAEKALDKLARIPAVSDYRRRLSARIRMEPCPVVVLTNTTSRRLGVESVLATVNGDDCSVSSRTEDVWPNRSVEVPLDLPGDGSKAHIKVRYSFDGKTFTESFEVAYRWKSGWRNR